MRVVHFLFECDFEISIILHEIKNPIRPSRVPLQAKSEVVVRLTLEGRCEGDLSFFENCWNVSKSAFDAKLVTLYEQVVPILLDSLGHRLLEAVDSVVQIAE